MDGVIGGRSPAEAMPVDLGGVTTHFASARRRMAICKQSCPTRRRGAMAADCGRGGLKLTHQPFRPLGRLLLSHLYFPPFCSPQSLPNRFLHNAGGTYRGRGGPVGDVRREGGRGRGRGGFAPGAPAPLGGRDGFPTEPRPSAFSDVRTGGGRDGRDTSRGRGYGPRAVRGREYDRRSGTGRGREVSKQGRGGKYTLGNQANDARAAEISANAALSSGAGEEGAVAAAADAASAGGVLADPAAEEDEADAAVASAEDEKKESADGEGDEEEAKEAAPAEPEEPKEMTLDEFLKMKAETTEGLSIGTGKGLRKANEGGDGFTNQKPLNKQPETHTGVIASFLKKPTEASAGVATKKAPAAKSPSADKKPTVDVKDFFKGLPTGSRGGRGGYAPRGDSGGRGGYAPRGESGGRGGYAPRGESGGRGGYAPRGDSGGRGGYQGSGPPRGGYTGPSRGDFAGRGGRGGFNSSRSGDARGPRMNGGPAVPNVGDTSAFPTLGGN